MENTLSFVFYFNMTDNVYWDFFVSDYFSMSACFSIDYLSAIQSIIYRISNTQLHRFVNIIVHIPVVKQIARGSNVRIGLFG